MKKKWIGMLAAASLACLTCGVVLAACNDTPGPGGPVDGQVTYTVSVKSVGGANLGDVLVAVYDKDNNRVREGRTDKNGNFVTYLEPDEYELDIAGLPTGYTLAEGNELALNATNFETVVSAQSAVISSTAPTDKIYATGDVMYDFGLRTEDGNYYTLSELLGQYKAVVLNFWATWCGPCDREFPAINNAYADYSNVIKFIAVDADAGTDADKIAQNPNALKEFFQTRFGIPTFEYAYNPGLGSHFDTSSIPITVCIDRYGVVASQQKGGEFEESTWRRNFAKWSADDYVQDFTADSDGDDVETGFMKPSDAEYPPETQSDLILKRVNGSHYDFGYFGESETADAEYSWPWNAKQVDEGDGPFYYLYPTNSATQINGTVYNYPNTFATIYSNFTTTEQYDTLKFEYKTSCEEDYDVLYVIVDDMLMFTFSGVMTEWATCYAYVSLEPGTHRLGLLWLKDAQENGGDDTVMVRNVDLVNHADIYGAAGFDDGLDLPREAASGKKTGGAYDHYVKVVLGDDGYYHVAEGEYSPIPDDEGAPYLFADLMNATNFSASSISQLAVNGAFVYADRDDTAAITEILMAANNSAIPGLIPVTEKLRVLLDRFMQHYSSDYNENKWLEVCKYFDHYGKGKGLTDLERNPVLGLSYDTAYEAYLTTHNGGTAENPYLNYVHVDRLIVPRGTKFRFAPEVSGVYRIETQPDGNDTLGWVFVRGSEHPVYSSDSQRENPAVDGGVLMTCYFDAGQEYFITMTYADLGVYGSNLEFTFTIEYLGASAEVWSHATHGAYTADFDSSNFESGIRLVSYVQPVLYGDYYYAAKTDAEGNYHKDANGQYVADPTRPIYVDFAHTTFMFPDNSLEDMLELSYFLISEADRATLKTYLPKMTDGTEDGNTLTPGYGYVHADRELAQILQRLSNEYGFGVTNNWLMLAYFFCHVGA